MKILQLERRCRQRNMLLSADGTYDPWEMTGRRTGDTWTRNLILRETTVKDNISWPRSRVLLFELWIQNRKKSSNRDTRTYLMFHLSEYKEQMSFGSFAPTDYKEMPSI